MNIFKLKISILTLWMSTSLVSFGQDYGKFGIRTGLTMPTGVLNTLIKGGVGLGIQANSNYFYQVRGRFTADVVKYNTTNQSTITNIYNYNTNQVENVDFTCRTFSTLDGSIGLDYKILPDKLPWLYCGPEVLLGADFASFTYSNPNFLENTSGDLFLHTAFKLNLGFEKSFGALNVFGEYSLMRMSSEIYDTENANNYTGQNEDYMFNYMNHKLTLGIKF
ncbi:MAG: hypothetical protein KA736_05735 [Crocinitomicaceae bacterium]|nr:hypothetical protein [Crocinitomicaceae bacterium]MBP6032016.1 hypothetical protein [Crocinitomicaceae bacterium]